MLVDLLLEEPVRFLHPRDGGQIAPHLLLPPPPPPPLPRPLRPASSSSSSSMSSSDSESPSFASSSDSSSSPPSPFARRCRPWELVDGHVLESFLGAGARGGGGGGLVLLLLRLVRLVRLRPLRHRGGGGTSHGAATLRSLFHATGRTAVQVLALELRPLLWWTHRGDRSTGTERVAPARAATCAKEPPMGGGDDTTSAFSSKRGIRRQLSIDDGSSRTQKCGLILC